MRAQVRLSESAGRWVLVVTALGSGLVLLEGTVVNVALPALGSDLDASLGGLQWTVNAFTLTLSALILLGGGLGDRFGRRRVYLLGIVWFGIASLLCAQSMGWLIAARTLQGARTMASGTLMKKTQRQPATSISPPPTIGPAAPATPLIPAHQPTARLRSSG